MTNPTEEEYALANMLYKAASHTSNEKAAVKCIASGLHFYLESKRGNKK